MGRFIVLVWVLAALAGAAGGADEAPDIDRLIEKVDRLYRSETSYAELEMQVVTPNWDRTLRMRMWTEGMDRTFIAILSPKKDAGIATLRKGTEMWNYFPKINKVMKVPPSMMMASWMGSDFTNDDLVKETSLLRDYEAAFAESESEDLYAVALTPRAEAATVWGKIVITIRKEDLIPVREVFYDEKGNRMRVMTFRELQTFGGRTLPAVLEMTPLNKTGHRTVFRYLEARFDEPLEDGVFSLRNLRRRR